MARDEDEVVEPGDRGAVDWDVGVVAELVAVLVGFEDDVILAIDALDLPPPEVCAGFRDEDAAAIGLAFSFEYSSSAWPSMGN